jgi:ABC-type multidrug transport system fused ATPase/permease subunit
MLWEDDTFAMLCTCLQTRPAHAVDTDSRIQIVMRNEFENATCITVAHRLNTIMDSDYILVMDDGRAAEFDKPKTLLRKTGGLFRALVEAHSNTGS